MKLIYVLLVALLTIIPNDAHSQNKIEEILLGFEVAYGDQSLDLSKDKNARLGVNNSASRVYSSVLANLQTSIPNAGTVSILGSTSVSPGTVRVNSIGTPSYSEDWPYILNSLDTPDKVSSYIVNNFTYSAHGSDTPYSPRDLNELRAGDCKDFAAFSGAILSAHGYKGSQISFGYAKNLGHAATLFYRNGSDWVMSNGGVYGPIQNPTDLRVVARQIIDAPPGYAIGPIIYFPLDYFGPFSIGDWSPS